MVMILKSVLVTTIWVTIKWMQDTGETDEDWKRRDVDDDDGKEKRWDGR